MVLQYLKGGATTDRDDHVGEVDHADGVLPLEGHGEAEAEAGDQMNMASGVTRV